MGDKEVLCVNCHRPIEPDPESVSGWWKHKDGKYSCFHNTNAEPPVSKEAAEFNGQFSL